MYFRKNRVKEKIARGELVLGMEIWLRDPRCVELVAQAGFDFAHIEYEHVARDWESVENFVRAAEAAGTTPLFRTEQCIGGRPPLNQIVKALKCGAQIIMVPQVETAEQARAIVAAAKFAPMGERGLSTCDRSSIEIVPNDKVSLDIPRYAREANAESMIWCLIESPRAIANIDEILAVDGIDVVALGHQDFALAAGLAADDAPEVDAARRTLREAVERAGKHMWWNTLDPGVIPEKRAAGIHTFLMGTDHIWLDKSLRGIVQQSRAGDA
jgi:4-hydroxy-2-oxoheptanedioate aldolase